MKLNQINYSTKADVTFTREELTLMLACSAVHYDGVCKDAGAEPECGKRDTIYFGNETRPRGFLRGMVNREKNAPGCSHSLSFRELDTLAKVLEVGRYLDFGRKEVFGVDIDPAPMKAPQALALHMAIRKTLIALNDNLKEPVVFP